MSGPTQQKGFVLALTLWVLAAMALTIGAFSDQSQATLRLAKAAQKRVQAQIDIAQTQAEILYRLSTTPMSAYGLGPKPPHVISLDDRPYQGEGQDIVTLQDDRGLVNLNRSTEDQIARLLGALGVPGNERPHLIDTLKDYTDADDLRRLNGAERREYLDAEYLPPRNDDLLIPAEAHNILGWRDYPGLWSPPGLPELTSTTTSPGLNPNTASPLIISALMGVPLDIAQNMTRQKEQTPYLSSPQLAIDLGVESQSLMLSVIPFPSDSIRITHHIPGQSWVLRYNVSLTGNAKDKPWRVNYLTLLERRQDHATTTPPALLPDKTAIPQDTGNPFFPF